MHYAELHCKTNFSFLTGASHADELAARARELQYAALAITDESSLAGIVRAHAAAKEANLKLIVGAELALEDANRVVAWVTDRAAYGRLCRLLTAGRRRSSCSRSGPGSRPQAAGAGSSFGEGVGLEDQFLCLRERQRFERFGPILKRERRQGYEKVSLGLNDGASDERAGP